MQIQLNDDHCFTKEDFAKLKQYLETEYSAAEILTILVTVPVPIMLIASKTTPEVIVIDHPYAW